MTDLRPTITPKSDQLNADDLIGVTRTITVTKVSLCAEADQPIAINFEGDNGKPYRPCKSMRRVMVTVWGPDGNAYVGRSMTIYRDDKVQFGGLAVGGIRISHMSHIAQPVTMALTATRANRKPFTVKPLKAEPSTVNTAPTARAINDEIPALDDAMGMPPPPKTRTVGDFLAELEADLNAAATTEDVDAVVARADVQRARDTFKNGHRDRLEAMIAAALLRFNAQVTEEAA